MGTLMLMLRNQRWLSSRRTNKKRSLAKQRKRMMIRVMMKKTAMTGVAPKVDNLRAYQNVASTTVLRKTNVVTERLQNQTNEMVRHQIVINVKIRHRLPKAIKEKEALALLRVRVSNQGFQLYNLEIENC